MKDYLEKQNPQIKIQNDELRLTETRVQLLMWGPTKNPRAGMKIILN